MEILSDPTMLLWGAGVPLGLVSCSLALRLLGMRGKTKLGSAEADVMSFEMVAGVCLVHLAYYGAVCRGGAESCTLT